MIQEVIFRTVFSEPTCDLLPSFSHLIPTLSLFAADANYAAVSALLHALEYLDVLRFAARVGQMESQSQHGHCRTIFGSVTYCRAGKAQLYDTRQVEYKRWLYPHSRIPASLNTSYFYLVNDRIIASALSPFSAARHWTRTARTALRWRVSIAR
jgi:hypothetical protein